MKIWTWAIKFAEDNVWEYSSAPAEMDMKEELLTSVKFGERPVIELAIIHLRSIIFLFNSEESAITFMEGYKMGHSTGFDGVSFWQNKLDQFIDAGLDGRNV